MDLLKALQLQALGHVLLDPEKRKDSREYREYWLRHIFRWYSKTFHTPLHVVDAIPLHDILIAYFEERYEGMNEEQLEEERALMCETDIERKKRLADEANAEAEMEEYLRDTEKKEQARLARIAAKQGGQKLAEGEAPGQLVMETMGGGKARIVRADEMPGLEAPVAQSQPPLISIAFPTDLDFEAQLEGPGTMGQPDKKR
jgi:hypothetical protein